MKHTLRDFIIGLTAIAGLLGVGALLVLFGDLNFRPVGRYNITLQLNDASGITGASRVTLNGVEVGFLQELRPAPDPRDGVLLDLTINQGVQIPRDVSVLLERGLVGEATLALRTRPLEPDQVDPGFVQAGETLAATSVNLLEEIGNQVSQALDKRLGGLSRAIDSFEELTASFTRIADQTLDLVEPRSIDDIEAGTAAPNFPSTLARLDTALASAQSWMGDDQLQNDAKTAARRAVELLDDMEHVVDAWTTAARKLSENSDRVGDEASAALTQFSQMTRLMTDVLDDTRAITSAINEGKGTAGMLIHNPDLYRSLNDAAIRLERALVEAQLLIEKYRTEGIPIQF